MFGESQRVEVSSKENNVVEASNPISQTPRFTQFEQLTQKFDFDLNDKISSHDRVSNSTEEKDMMDTKYVPLKNKDTDGFEQP